MKLSVLRSLIKDKLSKAEKDVKDADFILSEVLNINVSKLFMDKDLSLEEEQKINLAIDKRIAGMPVSKIFSRAYFYGLEFYVNEHVLSPRPETELLIETALKYLRAGDKVLDMCTGSGCIAISVKKNCDCKVTAVDISDKALEVAKKNAQNLGVDINFIKSNMFKNLSGQYDIILSNPPYIETEVCLTLEEEVKKHDPMLALDGGKTGLDFYKIIKNNLKFLKPHGVLICEIGYNQKDSVKEIFKEYNIEIIKDYNNLDRIMVLKNKEE